MTQKFLKYHSIKTLFLANILVHRVKIPPVHVLRRMESETSRFHYCKCLLDSGKDSQNSKNCGEKKLTADGCSSLKISTLNRSLEIQISTV